MDIRRYIDRQIERNYDGVEICDDIIEEMTEKLEECKEFYNNVKDMVSDKDRKILKDRYFDNYDLLEEIDDYKKSKSNYQEEAEILERIIDKLEKEGE